MTTIALATVADAISELSVSGVTIKDIDEIPQTINNRDCPLIVPDADNLIEGFKIVSDSFDKSKRTATYTLNFLMIYAQVGSGRNTVLEKYAGMIAAATAFMDAMVATSGLSGAVDEDPGQISNFGVIDVGGNSFHSCRVSVDIKEFLDD